MYIPYCIHHNVYTIITLRPVYCAINSNCYPSSPVITFSIIHKVSRYRQNMYLFPGLNCNANSIMMMRIKKTLNLNFNGLVTSHETS